MNKFLAFVLGGGGARGAMQIGALCALFEAGYKPDLLVGTSIGSVNAVVLALWGVNLDGVTALEWACQAMAETDLMGSWLPLPYHPGLRRLKNMKLLLTIYRIGIRSGDQKWTK